MLFGAMVVLAIFVLALVVGPPELGKPPDPTIISASPRPDWYFMWYFALLSLIPKWSERWVIILGPLVFGLFLILVPLLGGRGERSPLRRPWSILIIVFVVFVIAHYWMVGIRAPWSPRLEAPPLPASVVGVASGPIADGARVFYDKGCEYCHTVSGYGGIRGPDLSDAGDRMSAAQMATRIFSGAENMPSYRGNLKPEELASLLAFLASRHRVQLPKPPTLHPDAPPRAPSQGMMVRRSMTFRETASFSIWRLRPIGCPLLCDKRFIVRFAQKPESEEEATH